MIQQGDHPGEASIIFLPMIDLQPGDLNCINSTLLFVCDHAKRFKVTPVLTFDQPLWWKALCITQNAHEKIDLKSVVLRLGGFHTLMSFLGCIGHLMSGTALKEVMSLVYAENYHPYADCQSSSTRLAGTLDDRCSFEYSIDTATLWCRS